MKKITAQILIILSLFFLFPNVGKAADLYSASLKREIYLDNTTKFNVSNTFSLKNTSDTYLIKSFDYFPSLTFTDAEASIDGKNLDISIVESHIIINLGDLVLKPLMSEELVIKLKISDLVKPVKSDTGEVLGVELVLPKDTTKYLDILSQTTVNYDKSQFEPSYISTENQKDDSKISFTKNVDIYVDFSKIGGYRIEYKGENGKILLPSSLYNEVIFYNLPQESSLSNDLVGNTYLEKSGIVQYQVNAYAKLLPDISKFTQAVYFSKEDLSSFSLDEDIKGLYRQVTDKYSPETQTINTQLQSLADYEKNNFNDSLAYSATLASLLQQKDIPSQVVFGKVKLPISQNQIWHFWVVYSQDGKLIQLDPYMEDLLGFDGLNNIPVQRGIIAGYYNDASLINSIDNLINSETNIEFIKAAEDISTPTLAKLEVSRIPDSFYPKIKLIYKNLSSSPVTITGISLNGVFNSIQNTEISPGSQKEFEISLSLNIFNIVLKKGDIVISVQVTDNGIPKTYDTTTAIPHQVLLWIVMINFVSIFVGLSFILIYAKYKRSKI